MGDAVGWFDGADDGALTYWVHGGLIGRIGFTRVSVYLIRESNDLQRPHNVHRPTV